MPFSKGGPAGVLFANNGATPPSLACRLGRCFCRQKPAEVATGDPHPRRAHDIFAAEVLKVS